MLVSYRYFCLVVFTFIVFEQICVIVRAEKISDLRLCGDRNCKTLLSKARTLARHRTMDSAFLPFERGEIIDIYSKSAGSRQDLWGGELKGKRGYFPRSFVREYKVEYENPQFIVETEYHVPIEQRVHDLSSRQKAQQDKQSNHVDQQNVQSIHENSERSVTGDSTDNAKPDEVKVEANKETVNEENAGKETVDETEIGDETELADDDEDLDTVKEETAPPTDDSVPISDQKTEPIQNQDVGVQADDPTEIDDTEISEDETELSEDEDIEKTDVTIDLDKELQKDGGSTGTEHTDEERKVDEGLTATDTEQFRDESTEITGEDIVKDSAPEDTVKASEDASKESQEQTKEETDNTGNSDTEVDEEAETEETEEGSMFGSIWSNEDQEAVVSSFKGKDKEEETVESVETSTDENKDTKDIEENSNTEVEEKEQVVEIAENNQREDGTDKVLDHVVIDDVNVEAKDDSADVEPKPLDTTEDSIKAAENENVGRVTDDGKDDLKFINEKGDVIPEEKVEEQGEAVKQDEDKNTQEMEIREELINTPTYEAESGGITMEQAIPTESEAFDNVPTDDIVGTSLSDLQEPSEDSLSIQATPSLDMFDTQVSTDFKDSSTDETVVAGTEVTSTEPLSQPVYETLTSVDAIQEETDLDELLKDITEQVFTPTAVSETSVEATNEQYTEIDTETTKEGGSGIVIDGTTFPDDYFGEETGDDATAFTYDTVNTYFTDSVTSTETEYLESTELPEATTVVEQTEEGGIRSTELPKVPFDFEETVADTLKATQLFELPVATDQNPSLPDMQHNDVTDSKVPPYTTPVDNDVKLPTYTTQTDSLVDIPTYTTLTESESQMPTYTTLTESESQMPTYITPVQDESQIPTYTTPIQSESQTAAYNTEIPEADTGNPEVIQATMTEQVQVSDTIEPSYKEEVLQTSFDYFSQSTEYPNTAQAGITTDAVEMEITEKNETVQIEFEQVQPSLDQNAYTPDSFISRKPLSTDPPASEHDAQYEEVGSYTGTGIKTEEKQTIPKTEVDENNNVEMDDMLNKVDENNNVKIDIEENSNEKIDDKLDIGLDENKNVKTEVDENNNEKRVVDEPASSQGDWTMFGKEELKDPVYEHTTDLPDPFKPGSAGEGALNEKFPDFPELPEQESFMKSIEPFMKLLIQMLPPSLQSILEEEPLGLSPIVTMLVLITSTKVLVLITFIGCLCKSDKKAGVKDPLVVIRDLEEKLFLAVKEKENLEDDLQVKSKKLIEIQDEFDSQQSSTGMVQTDLKTIQLHNEALKRQLSELQTDLEDYKQEATEKSQIVSQKLSEVQTYESEVLTLTQRAEDAELALQKLSQNLSEKTEELNISLQQIQSQSEQIQQLETGKQQLTAEVTDWSERLNEMTEQIKEYSTESRRMQEDLAYKENELEVLRDCFLQVKAFQGDDEMSEEAEETPDLNEKLKQMMDVSRVNASLRATEEERDVLQNKLLIEVESREELEDQVQLLKRKFEANQTDKMKAERQCQEAQTKLDVLSKYFKEKEAELTRQLGEQEVLKNQNISKLQSSDSFTQELAKENDSYRQQIDELKTEITKAEKDFRSQIAANEKKAHENWLSSRAAERELKEARHECGMLRQKLTDLERKLMQGPPPGVIRPITHRGMPPPGMLNGPPPPPPPERPGSRGSVHGRNTPRMRDDSYLPPGPMGPRPPPPHGARSPPPFGVRPPFLPDGRSPPSDRYAPPRGPRPPYPRPPPPHLRSPPPPGSIPSEHDDKDHYNRSSTRHQSQV